MNRIRTARAAAIALGICCPFTVVNSPVSATKTQNTGDDHLRISEQNWDAIQHWLDSSILDGFQGEFRCVFTDFALIDDWPESTGIAHIVKLSARDRFVSSFALKATAVGRNVFLEMIPMEIHEGHRGRVFSQGHSDVVLDDRTLTVGKDRRVAMATIAGGQPEYESPDILTNPVQAFRLLHADRNVWQRVAMPDRHWQKAMSDWKEPEVTWKLEGQQVVRQDKLISTRFSEGPTGRPLVVYRRIYFDEESGWMPVLITFKNEPFGEAVTHDHRFQWVPGGSLQSSNEFYIVQGRELTEIRGISSARGIRTSEPVDVLSQIAIKPLAGRTISGDMARQIMRSVEIPPDYNAKLYYHDDGNGNSGMIEIAAGAEWSTITPRDALSRETIVERMSREREKHTSSVPWISGVVALVAIGLGYLLYTKWGRA